MINPTNTQTMDQLDAFDPEYAQQLADFKQQLDGIHASVQDVKAQLDRIATDLQRRKTSRPAIRRC